MKGIVLEGEEEEEEGGGKRRRRGGGGGGGEKDGSLKYQRGNNVYYLSPIQIDY